MAVRFFNRNIAEECHQTMRSFAAAGNDIAWVAFAPGSGARWSIVGKDGAYSNRNIPDECHQQMGELSKNGARIVCVAFPPQGGNSWSIVNSQGLYFNRNIPDECHQAMGELSKNGAKIVSVAFPPQGGNSWSIVNNQGLYFNRNIPDECHQAMGELSKNGAKIVCVAFPPPGGNRWSVVNDRGVYLNRNIPDEAHMYMGYYSQIFGPVRIVAFDKDGDGWSVTAAVTRNEVVCDATRCVAIADVYSNIAKKLNGNVVGYACTVGASSIGAYSHGFARTAANAPARLFLPSTKITVASVVKVLTAVAAVRLLGKKNVSLDEGIGDYLPSGWSASSHVKAITFRELLRHRSGIKDYGNTNQDYAGLKAYFTQAVDPSKGIGCQGAAMVNPANSINPNDKSPCYSNYNFSIFRVLLPRVDGLALTEPNAGAKYAAAFIKILQKHVFDPVGVPGMDAKPPTSGPQASGYALAYAYPGTSAGFDWGDSTLYTGAAGLYISIDDIAKVLYSLNTKDDRILTDAQIGDMETMLMGWDVNHDGTGYRWVQKNGGFGANGTTISTSIALFGPGVFGALFMNSDVLGPHKQNNWKRCVRCQTLVFAGGAAPGGCPARGTHDNTQGLIYLLASQASGIAGQDNWRWCSKCQALWFAGGTSNGVCSGGGAGHSEAGSGNYVLPFRGSGPLPGDTQEGWRWCKKCQVLAFSSNPPGACPAGDAHDHSSSGHYCLEYFVGADTVLREAYMRALKPRHMRLAADQST